MKIFDRIPWGRNCLSRFMLKEDNIKKAGRSYERLASANFSYRSESLIYVVNEFTSNIGNSVTSLNASL